MKNRLKIFLCALLIMALSYTGFASSNGPKKKKAGLNYQPIRTRIAYFDKLSPDHWEYRSRNRTWLCVNTSNNERKY